MPCPSVLVLTEHKISLIYPDALPFQNFQCTSTNYKFMINFCKGNRFLSKCVRQKLIIVTCILPKSATKRETETISLTIFVQPYAQIVYLKTDLIPGCGITHKYSQHSMFSTITKIFLKIKKCFWLPPLLTYDACLRSV